MITPDPLELELLDNFLQRHPRTAVLTGAGISAASGIPTYRDAGGAWLGREPIRHQDFVSTVAARQRYWARSFAGWPAVAKARPNPGHEALARLESQRHISLLITQNVDRLHQRAGSQQVVDLHGRLDRVICLNCANLCHRSSIQQRLGADNPQLAGLSGTLTPDGDADVAASRLRDVKVPDCETCGGMLMPDVVFFGGTVPRSRVAHCTDAINKADALVAIGSSLQVFSGYRFCRQAVQAGKPLLIINPGRTRADELASLKLHSACAPLLQAVSGRLTTL
jgi:NAD-dependent SIR2 family protein deacetylase